MVNDKVSEVDYYKENINVYKTGDRDVAFRLRYSTLLSCVVLELVKLKEAFPNDVEIPDEVYNSEEGILCVITFPKMAGLTILMNSIVNGFHIFGMLYQAQTKYFRPVEKENYDETS